MLKRKDASAFGLTVRGVRGSVCSVCPRGACAASADKQCSIEAAASTLVLSAVTIGSRLSDARRLKKPGPSETTFSPRRYH